MTREESGEAMPDKCYRIIVREKAKGKPRVLAYIVPQTVIGREPSAQFLVSVDQIEQATHLALIIHNKKAKHLLTYACRSATRASSKAIFTA